MGFRGNDYALIEEFKDVLAEKKISPKQFYQKYISRKREYKKTSYKGFLKDLENIGMESEYISRGIYNFLKDHV